MGVFRSLHGNPLHKTGHKQAQHKLALADLIPKFDTWGQPAWSHTFRPFQCRP